MNSYERVKTTLELKEPDRVPIVEFAIDPRVIKGVCPEAEDQSDFEEIMELDGVCCGAKFDKVSEGSDGTYIDEWGVLYKSGPEVVSHPVKGPIQTRDNLEDYTPPAPDALHFFRKTG